jgi:tRNA (guanosine-2'-O-)-methyltransferase
MLEERVRRIEQVVSERTFSLVPVIEGLYDVGNVSTSKPFSFSFCMFV